MLRGLVLALVACGGSPSPPPVASRIGPAIAAAFQAADLSRAPWRCAADDGPKLADETIKSSTATWKLSGHTVTLEGDGKQAFSIGVLADAGGSAATTLATLGRMRTQLAKIDLLITLGGMGSTEPEIEATLAALSSSALVIALAGDLESASAQTAAIAALRARGLLVIDGRLAHHVEVRGASIALLPGARSAKRLAAGNEGCGYRTDDVTALVGALTAKPQLRILASSEAPRTSIEGEPAGELALGAFANVDLVLHAPLVETPTPARAGDRGGKAIALSPGTSDATTRLPGPRHVPSAGVLLLVGGGWRWTPLFDQK